MQDGMCSFYDYEAIIDNVLESFWMIDPHGGIIVDVNKTYCELTGYLKEDIVGKKISDFDVGDSDEAVRLRIANIYEYGSCSFITKHIGKNGKIFELDITAKLHTLNGREYILSFMRDSKHSISYEMYHMMQDTLFANSISTWRWGFESDIVEWDELSYTMLGYEPNDFLINYQKWVSLVHQDDIKATEEEVQRCVVDGSSTPPLIKRCS